VHVAPRALVVHDNTENTQQHGWTPIRFLGPYFRLVYHLRRDLLRANRVYTALNFKSDKESSATAKVTPRSRISIFGTDGQSCLLGRDAYATGLQSIFCPAVNLYCIAAPMAHRGSNCERQRFTKSPTYLL
jgi:hypothetical protein